MKGTRIEKINGVDRTIYIEDDGQESISLDDALYDLEIYLRENWCRDDKSNNTSNNRLK